LENNLLSIQNLTVNFSTLDGVINAIEAVNINITNGEVVAIVGESGSGKSVTAMSILQLHPKAITKFVSGKVLFNSNNGFIDLLNSTNAYLQNVRGNEIAMIFQEPMTALNPVMRCGEQVAESLIEHQNLSEKDAKQKVINLFTEVQLPEPEKTFLKYPHELSGGQKQRVMIAMAMCCNPKLLICDEPTTALDVTVQKNILQLIKSLQKEKNMGVLFISHDLGLVKEIADKIVVMYKGKIVEQGAAENILTQPKHPYTKALLACRPILYPKGTRLPIVADFLDANLQSEKIQPQNNVVNYSPHEKIIEVRNLTISYPTKKNIWGTVIREFVAVHKVSFDIYKGETLGLVGESGCGKTTLGRAILQLNKPVNGEIFYHNKKIISLNKKQKKEYKKEVQMVFQDPYSSLNPRITIGSVILEPILVNKIESHKKNAKDAVMNLLEKVELKPEHFSRYPHEFSGGQRQRIVIARALALNPKFVVCDESVSALDVSVQAQILNLLNDLKKEFGFTTLFISHDLAVVRYISDRIMVMEKGSIVETNTADELFNNPQNAYTKRLMESMPE
jgi:peptide/nickel transport system ATP-binding protein